MFGCLFRGGLGGGCFAGGLLQNVLAINRKFCAGHVAATKSYWLETTKKGTCY